MCVKGPIGDMLVRGRPRHNRLNRRPRIRILAALIAVLVPAASVGCRSTPPPTPGNAAVAEQQPDWTRRRPADPQQYYYGIGTASYSDPRSELLAPALAEMRARQDLARQARPVVAAALALGAAGMGGPDAGDPSVDRLDAMTARVVELAASVADPLETWRDPASRRWFTLVRTDKTFIDFTAHSNLWLTQQSAARRILPAGAVRAALADFETVPGAPSPAVRFPAFAGYVWPSPEPNLPGRRLFAGAEVRLGPDRDDWFAAVDVARIRLARRCATIVGSAVVDVLEELAPPGVPTVQYRAIAYDIGVSVGCETAVEASVNKVEHAFVGSESTLGDLPGMSGANAWYAPLTVRRSRYRGLVTIPFSRVLTLTTLWLSGALGSPPLPEVAELRALLAPRLDRAQSALLGGTVSPP
jgi:hypothetical protein